MCCKVKKMAAEVKFIKAGSQNLAKMISQNTRRHGTFSERPRATERPGKRYLMSWVILEVLERGAIFALGI